MIANQKFIAGALLFILWTCLVLFYSAPVEDLITWIKYALGALFGYHAITNLKGSNQ